MEGNQKTLQSLIPFIPRTKTCIDGETNHKTDERNLQRSEQQSFQFGGQSMKEIKKKISQPNFHCWQQRRKQTHYWTCIRWKNWESNYKQEVTRCTKSAKKRRQKHTKRNNLTRDPAILPFLPSRCFRNDRSNVYQIVFDWNLVGRKQAFVFLFELLIYNLIIMLWYNGIFLSSSGTALSEKSFRNLKVWLKTKLP